MIVNQSENIVISEYTEQKEAETVHQREKRIQRDFVAAEEQAKIILA